MSKYLAASAALVIAATLACHAQAAGTAPKKTLPAFASEAQLRDFFKRYGDEQRARQQRYLADAGALSSNAMQYSPSPPPPPASAPVAEMAAPAVSKASGAVAARAADGAESVTNTQTAGVDEGGIVKVHGKHLVMLRRGRLFTVDIGRQQLRPISSVDAYAPEADPSGSWYDEMIIAGDTVAVIGYSYSRGGTEIGLFDIDDDGRLSYRSTYHMRSNDYYSSRNYASRQIGSKLIFYTPLSIDAGRADPFSSFPALRKWRPNATPNEFQRIAPATRIYRTDDPLDAGMTLHTVTTCDLARREMRCEASAVLGPAGRVFYVSSESVYVWTTPSGRRRGDDNGGSSSAGLFRIPLDGGAPSALKVSGSPIDQFSFLESGDGYLNVMVRSEGRGDGMWHAERGRGDLALMRVALRSFSDGRDSAAAQSYRPLPVAGGYALQNRFVGDYLLYGSADGSALRNDGSSLQAVRWDGEGEVQILPLPHGVERIEAMGKGAVAIGSGGRDLHFTSIELARVASLGHRYIRKNAAQGETRSHGFFYKSERADEGIVGLPIVHAQQGGSTRYRSPAASVLYLRNASYRLSELGSLASQAGRQADDGCVASCVDWYGNARPLFLNGRVFALMGYELVEGRVEGSRLFETRRINYAPGPSYARR